MNRNRLTRRDFLKAGAATGTVAAMPSLIAPFARAKQPKAAGVRRLRSHRNLFNGDCYFLFYNATLWQPEGGKYSARAIRRYVDVLASSGIDTLLVNPNTQVVWYPSKKLEYGLDGYRRGDREFVRTIAAGYAGYSPQQVEQAIDDLLSLFDSCMDLTESEVDWLAECAAACRQRDISPWLSYRMNATHCSAAPNSPGNCRLFREAKYRLSGRIPGPHGQTDPGWIGLDYQHCKVRDYMLEMIREGIEAYDYDGLEMDWLRHPVCLEPPATQRQIDLITDWFSEVTAMARARRPFFPVGMRLPGSLGYLRNIGIDVKAIVQRGLVDFLTFSNFWQTSWEMPHDELRRELGPDVTIYGGMEDAPNWLETDAPTLTQRPTLQELQLAGDNAFRPRQTASARKQIRGTRYLSASVELMRANAAGKLVLGADGIEQFNFFVTDAVRVPGQRADYTALRRLDDLAFLRGKEKHYALNTCSAQPNKIWDRPEQLPVRLEPKYRRAFQIPMCAEPAEPKLRLVVQVVTDRLEQRPEMGMSVNGAWPVFECHETDDLLFPAGPYSKHVNEHTAWNYSFNVGVIRDGWNEIVISNESQGEMNIVCIEFGLIKA